MKMVRVSKHMNKYKILYIYVQYRSQIKLDKAFIREGKMGTFGLFNQLWKAAWRVGDWKRSLSWRLFWWEQQPWQMGQLNHCGNGVLDGWLWISGVHCAAVPRVTELSEEFQQTGFWYTCRSQAWNSNTTESSVCNTQPCQNHVQEFNVRRKGGGSRISNGIYFLKPFVFMK